MSSHVMWTSDVQLAPELRSAATARAFVTAQLADGESTELVRDVRLVASELVTNAVIHAGTPILVALARLPSFVRLTVSDGSDDLPLLRPGHDASDDAEGGRGLWVTEECSSDWGTETGRWGGKSVWAVFDTPPPS